MQQSPPIGPSRLESPARWLSFIVPLLVSVLRACPEPQWRGDFALVRSLGFIPVAGEGTLAMLLTQLSAYLPVGGRILRAGLVSALGLGFVGFLIYQLCRRLLDAQRCRPTLNPSLALGAALLATLSPTAQVEATVVGGATIATALALVVLLLCFSVHWQDARAWFAFGIATGLLTCENHAAGIAMLCALLVHGLVERRLPSLRASSWFAAGVITTAAICLSPLVLRALSPHAWVHLGARLDPTVIAPSPIGGGNAPALDAWLSELGLVSAGLAVAGAVLGLISQRNRARTAALCVLISSDILFPAASSGLTGSLLTPLRLLALAALACSSALAVQSFSVWLMRAKLPASRAAAVMLVVFQFTLVFVAAEDSAAATASHTTLATKLWTDEALGKLPNNSLVLVRSESLLWRLWSARVVSGERPDVVIVPVGLLGRGSVARRLLELEPELAPVIRETSISGSPAEYGLSNLADARKLFVEFDPTQDQRLIEHLVPERLWLRFMPHAVGYSDRKESFDHLRQAYRRVALESKRRVPADATTQAVLAAQMRQQALALAAVGDREPLGQVLSALHYLDPTDPFVAEMRQRLHADRRGGVSIRSLGIW